MKRSLWEHDVATLMMYCFATLSIDLSIYQNGSILETELEVLKQLKAAVR